jgi:indolepyruvate ferredoxin oxidoreductase beta subunit
VCSSDLVITGERDYPSDEALREAFEALTQHYWLIDATSVGLELGNPVLSNIVMIGALAKTGLLPFDRKMFEKEIRKTLSADKRALNLRAFDAGAAMI